MKTFRLLPGIAIFALLVLFTTSCKKENEKSRLTVYLTDAPADYDAVNIEVVSVQVKATSDGGENGWQTLPMASSPANFNLLDFTNGMDTLLTSVELPVGKISQLRLVLGNNNSITVNGITQDLPLEVPSGSQSGLKFNIHADLVGGIEYKMWIDFDVLRSIVVNGAGNYILKPLIRTFTEATSGAIRGTVLPADANATVQAANGTDIFAAIPDATTGEFLIRGVPAGTWTVLLDGNNGYIDQSVTNVSVTIGQVADIGTMTLVK